MHEVLHRFTRGGSMARAVLYASFFPGFLARAVEVEDFGGGLSSEVLDVGFVDFFYHLDPLA